MDQPALDEIDAKLREPKTDILLILHREGALAMRKLRKKAGFPSGSRGHHPDKLEEWGLIEVIARDADNNNERTYDLTDRGHEFVNDHLLDGVGEVPEHIENTLEQQRAKIEQLEEQVEANESNIRTLREATKETRQRLENFITAVKNDLGIDEEQ